MYRIKVHNNFFIGEHIKNWRSRYFVLRDDGTLVGFKAKPDPQMAAQTSTQPLNNFTVRGCQIMSVDRPKPYTFVIRGLQWTTVIERTFHVETEQEREDWVAAIRFDFTAILRAPKFFDASFCSSNLCYISLQICSR